MKLLTPSKSLVANKTIKKYEQLVHRPLHVLKISLTDSKIVCPFAIEIKTISSEAARL